MTDFLRQLDILNPNLIVFPVTLIGAGGIGRPTAETLAEMGLKQITIYDDDEVEKHNRPNQSYRKQDLGKLKVDAAKDIINQFAEWCEIKTIPERFYGQYPLGGIVISGVDKMEERKKIWQAVRQNKINIPLYIDGRIAAEVIQVHTIRPYQLVDVEAYEKTLYSDEEGAELPCTAQNIIYVGKIIGGLIASQVKKWLKKEPYYRRIDFNIANLKIICQ